MATDDKNNANGSTENFSEEQIPTLPISVNAQYIKDLSFETPGPMAFANEKESPSINLNIEVRAHPQEKANDMFEVELHVTAEATRSDKRVFLLELNYAGMFTLGDIPQQSVPPVLLIECPRLLFPFVRNIVADVTRDGGFPPLSLAPVDFSEIYRRQVMQMQEQQEAAS
ncbi:MAG: protein-export chaperone SecB [Alphaproteobacteria bacterium]|nr:protein-export chaperone SecB [Alphaproteobacteria bacterium]